MPTIAILFHHSIHESRYKKYSLVHCIPSWEALGFKVKIVSGIKEKTKADLVIPQIDLTITPKDYQAFLEEEKAVLNLNVTDTRKSTFSELILSEEDTYKQEVIVKTQLNCGGIPERYQLYRSPFWVQTPERMRKLLYRLKQILKTRTSSPLAYTDKLKKPYKVYHSLAHVPKEVFKNEHLIVEKYLPEYTGNEYILRSYTFLGDQCFAFGFKSKTKQFTNSIRFKLDSVPGDLIALKNELGFDYGKFDYVEVNGKATLLDINPTPCMDMNHELMKNLVPGILARGITSYFPK